MSEVNYRNVADNLDKTLRWTKAVREMTTDYLREAERKLADWRRAVAERDEALANEVKRREAAEKRAEGAAQEYQKLLAEYEGERNANEELERKLGRG